MHISENNFEYKGYFASNTTGAFVNVPIPQAAWSTMAYSNGGEPVTISLVFAQGANAYGPYTETWTIAQATLQGTIYYNSYGTALVKNSDTARQLREPVRRGTLAINPGATAPTLVAGVTSLGSSGDGTGCRVCHTVAANGQSLVTQASNVNASDYSNTVGVNLANDTTGGAGTSLATTNLTFPALYKDGSCSSPGTVASAIRARRYDEPALHAACRDPGRRGARGCRRASRPTLPTFSPDGAHVSFNFWAGSFANDAGATRLGRPGIARR